MPNNITENKTPSGIICINKPSGMTSHDVVNRLRRLYNTKKVGHTGTLDPMATGLLIVLVGNAVKASEYLMSGSKSYVAGLRLGMTSDTEDISGNITVCTEALPKKEEVISACEKFVGNIMQVPPMYSAIKIGGKKLVDLARNGETVEREPREITVYSLKCQCVNEESGDYLLDVECSKGTYIRTLCADIGASLSCGGLMSSLERRHNCGFSLDDAHTLEEIEALEMDERGKLLIPVEKAFSDYKKLKLIPFYAGLVRNGVRVYTSKVAPEALEGERFRLYDGENFFAIAEAQKNSEGESILRVLKQFV
jgi:tRNA pseudouridine55 synthase